MQHAHGFGGTHHFAGQTFDLRDGFVDDFVAFTGFAVSGGSGLRGFFGVARDFLHGGSHLVHRGGNLIGFDFLAVHAGAGLLGHGRQFFSGAGNLGDAVADAADQVAQGHAHARDTLLQHAEFVAAGDGDVLGQVAAGDALDHGQGFLQRTGDLTGDDYRSNHADQQRQQGADQLEGARLGTFDVATVELDLIQLLARGNDGGALIGHFFARLHRIGVGVFVRHQCAAIVDQCGF
ncbi:hypothetical protein D3C72_599500 [compost metagenome]